MCMPGGEGTGGSEAKGRLTSGMTRAEQREPSLSVQPRQIFFFLCADQAGALTQVMGGKGDLVALQHHSGILRSLTHKGKGLLWFLVLWTCWGCQVAMAGAFCQTRCSPCS